LLQKLTKYYPGKSGYRFRGFNDWLDPLVALSFELTTKECGYAAGLPTGALIGNSIGYFRE
jgi:hypothetical protein